MIAFIVPRREAGATEGLPHLGPWVRLAGYDRSAGGSAIAFMSRSVNLGRPCMSIF
ncbi:hypothetical protein QUA40_09595 [Microcoleus sp. Pol11C3]|uniref:hypothetical protein n=1 Tax=Microcoleus sp. Pol11C3 TaxID=3055390 RepID=UPI002FD3B1D3